MKPVEIEFLIKNLTKKSLDEISSDVGRVGKDGKESAGTVSAEFQKLQQQSRVLKDVISGLEAKVSELRAMEAGGPDMDQKDNIASIEALEAKIKELQLQLKQLEETAESVKVVPPEMQQAKSQYNGLHMSIQQIAREMPSLEWDRRCSSWQSATICPFLRTSLPEPGRNMTSWSRRARKEPRYGSRSSARFFHGRRR
jgi:DNA repair exonuclease SbcCD ATPase subunit